jgi:hypothetical protein
MVLRRLLFLGLMASAACWLCLAVAADPVSGPAVAARDAAHLQSSSIERSPRVLLIVRDNCPACDAELARLGAPGGAFDSLRRQRWSIGPDADSHIQIVNMKERPDLADSLGVQQFPTVACLHENRIVRSFTAGCRTPLDEWTFGWLLNGRDERDEPVLPESVTVDWTGHYPLRGNHWSIDGEWLPSLDYVIEHLRGENHLTQIPPNWPIDSWSYEELRSLHDDVHENDGIPKHPLKTYTLPPPLPEPAVPKSDHGDSTLMRHSIFAAPAEPEPRQFGRGSIR